MAKKATKAADNAYYIARIEASEFNDRFSSREGAGEALGIERTRLARIELESICPYPEEVLLMSDSYNAPELMNWHCVNQCPLGKHMVQPMELKEIAQLTIQLCASLKAAPLAKDTLIDIVADGVITEEEEPELERVLEVLNTISAQATSLKMWALKNLNQGG